MPANPNRSGYTFGGWRTARNGGGDEFTASTPVTADIRVYAHWLAERSGVVITPVFPTDEGSAAFTGEPIVLSKTGQDGKSARQILTVNGGFTTYTWRVDGVIKGNEQSLTLNAEDYNLGGRQISIEVELDSVFYSKSGVFTVLE
jgi:uncharacterized repeat protein (TIGR02543 family)